MQTTCAENIQQTLNRLGTSPPKEPYLPGKEDWRDGENDDGEPTEEEAMSIEAEDDPEMQNDGA